MATKSTLGVKEMKPAYVAHVQFKRRKIGNVRYKDFPSSKKFKVNDPCEMDLLRPYAKGKFKSFNKWLAGVVDNSMPIGLGVGSGDVAWFLDLKTPGRWLDGKTIICI